MTELRVAVIGTGFWARDQLAAWRELKGARCVALYNRNPDLRFMALADANLEPLREQSRSP